MRLWQRALGGLAALIAAAVLAPAALASTTPSITLNQSAGQQAGSSANLGLTLNFTNTGSDSPEHLVLNLPPGLLANTAQNGGSCLQRTQLSGTACEIGTGVVTSDLDPLGLHLPIISQLAPAQNVVFYLVPPPSPGDLAGLVVYDTGILIHGQLGPTADIKIRPTGDPLGVGATINLTLPDRVTVLNSVSLQISVEKIQSTFLGLRYPSTCPSTPAALSATVDSYQDTTVHPLSAPLAVSGCSSLSYAPQFSVSASRDSADHQVSLATNITESATQAPSRSVALAFPTSVFGPNLAALGALCPTVSASCPQVGSVTATSPLYPVALSGKAYLSGNSSGLLLTLVFPTPFPLTLTGSINLLNNSASFTGLPDIPLSSLQVTLSGGSRGLFATTCQTPSGTATAGLTDQNGDQSRNLSATFSVVGCPGVTSSAGGTSGTGGGTSGGAGGSAGSGSASASAGGTHLVAKSISGLQKGKPTLTFLVSVSKTSPKVTGLTVALPSGLSFTRHRVKKQLKVTGVSLSGAAIKSLALSHGHLVITLKKAAAKVTVKLSPSSVRESSATRSRAEKKKLKSLKLKVTVRNAKKKTRALTVTVTNLHL